MQSLKLDITVDNNFPSEGVVQSVPPVQLLPVLCVWDIRDEVVKKFVIRSDATRDIPAGEHLATIFGLRGISLRANNLSRLSTRSALVMSGTHCDLDGDRCDAQFLGGRRHSAHCNTEMMREPSAECRRQSRRHWSSGETAVSSEGVSTLRVFA